jgi:glycogen operon protein
MKLLKHQTGFQNVMRRFLKGDEGMVGDVIYWLRRQAGAEGFYNYITNQNGFTLNDLISYDAKHNEANGENNQDGPDYNYSWNCGAEGPSRKKAVTALREGQRRNAFFLVLLAQGTPCLLAGDEFGNTQKGNNNAYCQDNPTGWLDWSRLEKERKLFRFVRDLIAFRKAHPVLAQEKELLGMDQLSCGVPDVSYHGTYAWQTPSEVSSRQLGVCYCGKMAGDADCFVAYNMHWLDHSFALPALPKGKKWYLAADTKEGIRSGEELLDDQREAFLSERTIAVFVGK